MMKFAYPRLAILACVGAALLACGDDGTGPDTTPIVREATLSGDITADRTLHSDTVYTLSGFVHVANGATLTIEPGTRIVGDPDVLGTEGKWLRLPTLGCGSWIDDGSHLGVVR